MHLKKAYSKAITVQLKYELQRYDINKNSIQTLFIGGGTPSTLEPKLYEKFLEILSPYLKKDIEFTTEANPNSATYDWLRQMKNLGVNRVSFGVQSFHDQKLKYLGRNHSNKDAVNAVENAYKADIQNISLDLIYDTLCDTKDLLKRDLDIAFSLPINHISSYSLTIEKATKFHHDNISPKDDESLAYWFVEKIKERFPQYEISNFGLYKSKHNIGYWKLKNYIGIGSGAVGFLENKRFYPTTNVKNYIKNPLSQKTESLSKKDIKTEKIFLGLRSFIGVKKDILSLNELEKANILVKEGKLICDNLQLFNPNYFLADEIALFLMED